MIVVGIDSSLESKAALRWAVDEAKLRDTGVLALYAWQSPAVTATTLLPPDMLDPEYFASRAKRVVDAAVAEVAAAGSPVAIEGRATEGQPARVLVDAAGDTDLLVLGSRGHGGFAGLLLGSVGQQCVHHARCPVVIVREDAKVAS
jgi:nucleotide-binding universal stress UspA family protein